MATKRERIDHLKNVLSYHDDLYYNEDNPEITDAEYDALKKEYLSLTGEDEYTYVPGEALKGNKVAHTHPIRSLSKVNTEEDLRAEIKRLWPVVIQPKIDGLTVVGYPGTVMGAGKLATRGNGTIGEDITSTALRIDDINRVDKIDYIVRMEAYMPISVFNALNAEREAAGEELFKNPRNAAAGMLRQKDTSKVKGLKYWAYNIVGSEKCESEQLKQLEYNKFNVIPSWYFDTVDDAVEFIMNFDRSSLDYEIDGMVIKSDIENSLAVFGETGHHPKNAVAYKFPAQGVWTKLLRVVWQVGRTGKVTPVAEFEPIDLLGATVTRATLHNMGIINTLGLRVGEQIFVIKANDVIPAVIECRQSLTRDTFPIIEPRHCPDCKSPLTAINDQIFCTNHDCPSQRVGNLVHLAKRDALNIEGLSEETADKMFAQSLIKSPFDIFTLTIEDLMKIEGYAKRSAEKLYNNIQAARKTEFKRFLYAAGLPNIGRSVSEDIAKAFGTWDAFVDDGINNFVKTRTIEGIGDVLIKSMTDYGYLWGELRTYVEPIPMVVKQTTVPDKVLTIVVTGTFDIGRADIEQMVKDAGHKASGSVSKKTDYVLVGEAAGSKATKAAELGIKILNSVDELKAIING